MCVPSTSALHTPVMNYTVVSANETARNISIKWRTPDSTKRDMEYLLSMISSSHRKTWTTNQIRQTLTIHVGINYTLTVIVQRCKGNLTSNSSNPLLIYFPGMTVSVLFQCVASIYSSYSSPFPQKLFLMYIQSVCWQEILLASGSELT